MQPDTVATPMDNFRLLHTMIKTFQNFKVQKMGQILCVKKVPFRKSGHILRFFEGELKACNQ